MQRVIEIIKRKDLKNKERMKYNHKETRKNTVN